MSVDWQAVPQQFHYLKNLVLERRPDEMGIAHYDPEMGRHVGLGERLSEDELSDLARVYVEICRREDNLALLDWLDEARQGADAERDAAFYLRCLLQLLRELAQLGALPFAANPIVVEKPPPPLDWSILPTDLDYLAEAVEKYSALGTEMGIYEWLDRASARDFVELSNLAQRMSRDEAGIRAWSLSHKGRQEEFCVAWLYLIFDHAHVVPDANNPSSAGHVGAAPGRSEPPASLPATSAALAPWQRGIVLAGVICLLAFGNLLIPSVVSPPTSPGAFYLTTFAAGLMVAEMCLLATWSALGGQPVAIRIPLSLAVLLIAACSLTIGLQLAEDGMPLEAATFIFGVFFTVYLLVQVPLGIVRAATGRSIMPPGEVVRRTKREPVQFGVRYLLVFTAAVGVLLVVVRHSLPKGGYEFDVDWGTVIAGGGVFLVYSVLLCLPCVWLVLADDRRAPAAAWLGIAGVCGSPLVLATLVVVFGRPLFLSATIGAIICFSLGVGGTTIVVLVVVRNLGYRLVGRGGIDHNLANC